MAVGEPEKDNSPVDCCPGERPSQEGLGRPAKRRRDSEAQGRSAGGKARDGKCVEAYFTVR